MRGGAFLALAAALVLARAASAGITVVNLDGPGEGFNDPTAVSPVGGNPSTTRGGQRLFAMQHAAAIWATELVSDVDIRIGANFNPLSCNASSATLGQAGPTLVFRDFAGAPLPGTWYPQALANQLAGEDNDPGSSEIEAEFNSAIGTTCAFPNTWYYGVDGNPGPSQTDFVSVALHEIGHGLGFLSLVDLDSGEKLMGFNDAYILALENHDTFELYPTMTNAERVAAATNGPDLHWVGPAVVGSSGVLSSGRHPSGHVEMYAPPGLEPGSSVSHFSTSCVPNQLMEPIYTGPNHALGLSRELMDDLGWSAAAPICGNGVVQSGEQCDDGNTANGDCCSATCTFEAAASPCTDQSVCTFDDTCNTVGICVGTPIDCDDGDLCTADTCDRNAGCVHTPDASPCNDGNTCTADACLDNACVNTILVDFTGAFCALDTLNSAVCNPEAIDSKLQRSLNRRSAKARRKLEATIRSTSPARRLRLLASASRIIAGIRNRVERSATKGLITGTCQGTINGRTDMLVQIIGNIS